MSEFVNSMQGKLDRVALLFQPFSPQALQHFCKEPLRVRCRASSRAERTSTSLCSTQLKGKGRRTESTHDPFFIPCRRLQDVAFPEHSMTSF